MELQQVATGDLKPNDYNFNRIPQGDFAELVQQVRERGHIFHHIVAEQRGEGPHIIVDGEHQWRAAQQAGLATVPVQFVTLGRDLDRVSETWRRNGLRGEANRVLLGRAIRDARAKQGEVEGKLPSLKALAPLFGKTDVWVRSQLDYAELADLAGSRTDLPATAEEVARLTEKEVKELLALARGAKPTEGDDDGEGVDAGNATEPKAEPDEDEKHNQKVVKLKLAVQKLPAEDRAEIRKALDEADRQERAKAAKAKESAAPKLPSGLTDADKAARAEHKAAMKALRGGVKGFKKPAQQDPAAAPKAGQEGQA